MSNVMLEIKGDKIPLHSASVDLDVPGIVCDHSEELAASLTGWMPVDVLLHVAPCRFPVALRLIDCESLKESGKLVLEFDGPVVIPE